MTQPSDSDLTQLQMTFQDLLDRLAAVVGQDLSPRRLLTAQEAAAQLRVEDKHFRQHIAPRLPKVILDGQKRPRYMLADLWAYQDKCRREPISPKPASGSPGKASHLYSITKLAAERKRRQSSK